MDKYLVFRLEKEVSVNINSDLFNSSGTTVAIYREPIYENRLFPCFELVKEFDPQWVNPLTSVGTEANEFARQYSLDNGIRTVVIKGSVYGGY